MNGECVWRMLGEYVCDRLLKKCFVTLSMQSMCDDIQYLFKSFGDKLELTVTQSDMQRRENLPYPR